MPLSAGDGALDLPRVGVEADDDQGGLARPQHLADGLGVGATGAVRQVSEPRAEPGTGPGDPGEADRRKHPRKQDGDAGPGREPGPCAVLGGLLGLGDLDAITGV